MPNDPQMQDWEYEVADPSRIDEFVAAYEGGDLSEDERFTLMATIIQSFEEGRSEPSSDPRWNAVLGILDRDIAIHIFSVWYWANDSRDGEDWRVSPSMRGLLKKHRERFVRPNAV